ncbi:MAG: hypothetical protein KTR14_08720 [Vampirovibrio sp.]|nr:hypothetical protein [Vampirovibrio sp.]
MKPVDTLQHNGQVYVEPWLTQKTVNFAHQVFNWPKKVEDFFSRRYIDKTALNQPLNPLQKIANKFWGVAHAFMNRASIHDYASFPKLFGMKISAPPIGALTLMILGIIVPARVIRAIERGWEDQDFREVGDVLRRDIIATTAILFALNPINNWAGKKMQDKVGLKMIDAQNGNMFTYEQLKNRYRIVSSAILKELFKTGQGNAVVAASQKWYALSFDELDPHVQKDSKYGQFFKEKIDDLRTQLQKMKDVANQELAKPYVDRSWDQLEKLSERAYGKLDEMNQMREQILAQYKGDPDFHYRWDKKGLPKFNNFLVRYAHRLRSRIDVASIAAVCVLIGYVPVLFNKHWKEWQYDEHMKELKEGGKPRPKLPVNTTFNPQQAFQQLQQMTAAQHIPQQSYTYPGITPLGANMPNNF